MKPNAVGDCDCCPRTSVPLYESVASKGSMMCVECWSAEKKAVEDTKWIQNALVNGSKIETPPVLKQDIFVSSTAAFVEIQAAVNHDDSIPANRKNEVFMQRVEARIKSLREVIFNTKNEVYALSQQAREFIGKLQESEREKFKQYDVNYAPKPVSPKKVKDAAKDRKPRTRTKSIDMKALKAAATKYGVAWAQVQSIYVRKPGISYELAARELAEMMGLIPESN